MLLAIDIGNTNITLGGFEDKVLTFTARMATDTAMTSDQYASQFKNILSLYNQDYEKIDDCIVSSVVPSVGSAICRAVSLLCDIVPLSLGPGVKTGLNIKIDNPAQLGADLVAGAVGAISEYTLPETNPPNIFKFIPACKPTEAFKLIQAEKLSFLKEHNCLNPSDFVY